MLSPQGSNLLKRFFYFSKSAVNWLFPCLTSCTKDGHPNKPPENSSTAAIGPRGPKAGPIFWIWRCCPLLAYVHLCANRPLACLHLVCYWICGEAVHWDRLAGQLGRATGQVVQWQWLYVWSISERQVRHCPLFHLEQFDKCGVRQCLSEHQLREDLLHLRHGHWLWVNLHCWGLLLDWAGTLRFRKEVAIPPPEVSK